MNAIYYKNLTYLLYIFLKENEEFNKINVSSAVDHIVNFEPYLQYSHPDLIKIKNILLDFVKNNDSFVSDRDLNDIFVKNKYSFFTLDKINNKSDYLLDTELSSIFFAHFSHNLGNSQDIINEKISLKIALPDAKDRDNNFKNIKKI